MMEILPSFFQASAMPHEPMLVDLAITLRNQHEEIMNEWKQSVLAEKRSVSALTLSDEQLRDHLTQLLEDLANQLRKSVDHESEASALKNAEIHGDTRWTQRYELHELLREIAMLRTIVIGRVVNYTSREESFSTEATSLAHKIIHRFFDALIVDSASLLARKQHAALEDANAGLTRKNREYYALDESRMRMLRTVVHELRDPLHALLLTSDLLASSDNAACNEAAEAIRRTVGGYEEILRQLLDFSVGQENRSLHIASFALFPLFENVVVPIEVAAKKKGLSFRAYFDPALRQIVGDESRTRMIVRNLLSNAVKYCDSGEIEISIRVVNEELWSIDVRDTGRGIPASQREMIFAEFHRVPTHFDRPGTGLGLSIVKAAVDALGGSIELEGEEGEGSRFIVTLPRMRSNLTPPKSAQRN